MLKRFIEFIGHHQLCLPNTKLYIALSSGVDSIVLTHLAMQAGFDIHVLHANFKLRGSESDQDANFVEQFCKENDLPFTVKTFSLDKLSGKQKLNIQDSARKMRYTWFDKILIQNPNAKVATAHHHDDNIETIILNILRGTGIKGICGIPVRRGNIIRPLLFARKKEILEYSQDQKLSFREDSSNRQLHYLRNRIRKQLIPIFYQMHPQFDKIMEKNIRIWNETSKWIDSIVYDIAKDSIHIDGSFRRIDLKVILETANPPFLLFEILSPYGFSRDQIGRLYKAIYTKRTGARFRSKLYELIVNRKELVIHNRSSVRQSASFNIEAPGKYVCDSGVLVLEYSTNFYKEEVSPTEANFDGGNIRFPLTLRVWKHGDSFQPFGMGGKHQKIKKFLTDKKIDRFEKERTLVLCSADEICWVVGHRIDHRFRITEKTQSVIRCSWLRKNT